MWRRGRREDKRVGWMRESVCVWSGEKEWEWKCEWEWEVGYRGGKGEK